MSGLGEFFYFVGIVDYAVFIGSLEIIITSEWLSLLPATVVKPFTGISNNVSDMLSTTGSISILDNVDIFIESRVNIESFSLFLSFSSSGKEQNEEKKSYAI